MTRQYRLGGILSDPGGRMSAAARLRARGLSLRQIAAQLACSHATVRRDLARWQQEQPGAAPGPGELPAVGSETA